MYISASCLYHINWIKATSLNRSVPRCDFAVVLFPPTRFNLEIMSAFYRTYEFKIVRGGGNNR